MLAMFDKVENGYMAVFNRYLPHSVEEVWGALTTNEKLERWFSNLQVIDLQKGGTIKFNMNDGSGAAIDMKIIDFEKNAVLAYEWGEGTVRFELTPQSNGCLLVLKDFFPILSDRTAKDISGWHITLDVMAALLKGIYMEFPMDEWETVFEKYKVIVDQVKM